LRKTGLENIKIKSRFVPVPSETGAFGGPDQRNSKPFGSHFVGSRAISLRRRMPDPCTGARSRGKSGPRQTFRTERGFFFDFRTGRRLPKGCAGAGKPLFLRGIAKPVLLYTMINGGMRSEGTPKEKWGFIGAFSDFAAGTCPRGMRWRLPSGRGRLRLCARVSGPENLSLRFGGTGIFPRMPDAPESRAMENRPHLLPGRGGPLLWCRFFTEPGRRALLPPENHPSG